MVEGEVNDGGRSVWWRREGVSDGRGREGK